MARNRFVMFADEVVGEEYETVPFEDIDLDQYPGAPDQLVWQQGDIHPAPAETGAER